MSEHDNEFSEFIDDEPKPDKLPPQERFERWMETAMDYLEKMVNVPTGLPMMMAAPSAMPPLPLRAPHICQVEIFSARSPGTLRDAVNTWLRSTNHETSNKRLQFFAGEFHLLVEYYAPGEITDEMRAEYERAEAEYQESVKRHTADAGGEVPSDDARVDEGNAEDQGGAS